VRRRLQIFRTLVAVVVIVLCLLLSAACSHQQTSGNLFIVDLNRTTTEVLSLTNLSSGKAYSVAVNTLGAYVLSTDSLETGFYLAEWDSVHTLPLFLRHSEPQKICGAWQAWSQLSFSSAESEKCVLVERLRADYARCIDSVLAWRNISDVKGRAALADSIATIRRIYRHKADRLLHGSDTTMAAIPLLLSGLYNVRHDSALVCKTVEELNRRFPDDDFVSLLSEGLDAYLDSFFRASRKSLETK
jgi:hypothetical protein